MSAESAVTWKFADRNSAAGMREHKPAHKQISAASLCHFIS
jgi:hypothetical protein